MNTTIAAAPFGRLMTAMITPMSPDGAVDFDGAARLAAYLVDDMRNEGLVVNGTTGEAPTTTDEEEARLVKVVREAVGGQANGAQSSPGSGPTPPRTVSSSPGRPRRPARTACSWSPRTTTSPPRMPWPRTSPRSPTRPTCRRS